MRPIEFLKDVLRTVAYRSGLLGFLHRWRHQGVLTVLMFHRVLPEEDPAFSSAEREFTFTLGGFRKTLDFIQGHYQVVSLNELNAMRKGEIRPLRKPPLLITFDDGWRDTLDHAIPELQLRGLPAVLFVSTEVVELGEGRWWQDALVSALSSPGAHDLLWAAAGWGFKAPPLGASQQLAGYLAGMNERDRRTWLDAHAPGTLEQVPRRQMASLVELQSCDASTVTIGGHGHTHSPLTLSPEPEIELRTSLQLVEHLNAGVACMSFPHGACDSNLINMANKVGFEWVFTSEATLTDVQALQDRLPAIGRLHVPENTWTCRGAFIDRARLATFLFDRPVQSRNAQ